VILKVMAHVSNSINFRRHLLGVFFYLMHMFELDSALKGKGGKLMPIGKIISFYGIPLYINHFWNTTITFI
jgi:hypothetical protein